jgi:ectoine hydroxylase-related dioxygenase (phytanoyl-CoA dioxygenase family)
MRPAREIVEAYRRDGFVNLGSFFSPREVSALSTELERYVDAGFRDRDTGVTLPWLHQDLSKVPGESLPQLVSLWEVSGPFRELATDARIGEALATLAGATELQIFCDQVQYKPARSGGPMTWHQDAPYWGCVEPAILLTAWVALDDADVDNGCMWMVPGSHQWGYANAALGWRESLRDPETFGDLPPFTPPPGSPPWQAPRPCPVRAGEVHVHHCLTWHGSPVNRTERPRRAYAVHYMPTGVRFSGLASHPLARNISLPPGTSMLEDGEHFPVVFRASAT